MQGSVGVSIGVGIGDDVLGQGHGRGGLVGRAARPGHPRVERRGNGDGSGRGSEGRYGGEAPGGREEQTLMREMANPNAGDRAEVASKAGRQGTERQAHEGSGGGRRQADDGLGLS